MKNLTGVRPWSVPALLVAALLGACGTTTGLQAGGSAFEAASAGKGLPGGLGADISQDAGVSFDSTIQVQAARSGNVDLRDQCSPVANQGQFGSCTSFATVKGLQEFLLKKQGRFVPQSPAFIWYESRKRAGARDQDTGVPTEFAARMLDNLGSPDESTFPYLPDDQQKDPTARLQFLTRAPGSAIEAAAKKHRIVSGFKVATKISAVRTSLDGGLPVLLSMKVFSSIGKVGHDGKLPMPTTADKFEGGHAVLCVGYNDQEQHLIIRNSWGADWADGGYFYMPYAYVKAGFVRSAVIPKL